MIRFHPVGRFWYLSWFGKQYRLGTRKAWAQRKRPA